MAETTSPPAVTDPEKPGRKTSEGQYTLGVIISGILAILAGVAVAIAQLQDVLPGAPWLGVALAAIGSIQAIAAQLGFTKNRTDLKIAMLEARAAEATAAGEAAGAKIQTRDAAIEALRKP